MMSKELVIGSNRHETRVAILEDDQLVEVYFQRGNEYSLAGSIHKGRVTRVLPGMQSAFVDLGLERDTFLYVSDFFEENEDIDTVAEEKPAVRSERPERIQQQERNERPDRGQQSERGSRSEREQQPRRFERREPDRAPAEKFSPSGSVPAQLEAPIQESTLAESESDTPTATPPLTGSRAPLPITRTERSEDRAGSEQNGEQRFGQDRRGRRSRRRRPRPQGFPENKYASQPGVTPVAPSEMRRSEPAATAPVPREVEEPNEVMLLPGESLAKYRRNAPPPGAAAPQKMELSREQGFPEEPETGYGDAGGASETGGEDLEAEGFVTEDAVPSETASDDTFADDAATDEELLAEADELELTDKIFSHNDDESPEEVEEKIEEVKQDEAAGPGEETSVFSSAEFRPRFEEPEPLYAPMIVTREPQGFTSEPTEATDTHIPSNIPGQEDPEIFILQETVIEIDEPLEDAADVEEEQPEASERLSGSDPETQQHNVQTAAVREPSGGRFLQQRSSRRMRRRRGGNRFGQQQPQETPSTEVRPVENMSAGGGTAAAFEPEAKVELRLEPQEDKASDRPERVYPSISELLKPGQEIIVQIAKEPLGQKGARITSHIALPGRYVVFMPSVGHLGVSHKVASDEERQRLKRILQTHRVGTTGGFIVRTAGEGVPEEEIAADMNYLYTLWLDIRQKAEKKPAPALLHYDLDIVQRILRDQVTEEFKAIWVDNEDLYESVLTFMQRFQPSLVSRVKMYTRPAPIFDAFNITQELEKALRPKVWLKSGGYIVINQTEALVAIDINTGKYVGKSNRLEDTIVKTNTEAIKEIVRQIRLRDLGGIIVVDFIDMDERKNRQKVMQALEEAMQSDKAPYKILQFNDFGLVAITRKRVKQSLERTLCSPCTYCEGAGYVKSVQTVIGEILVEAQKIARAIEGDNVVLRVHPDVAKILKASDNQYLEELEEILRRPVLVSGDASLHHQKFDLG